MKTTGKHFNIFRDECERLAKEWQLNNWCIAYEHKKLETNEAQMVRDADDYTATFAFSTEISYGDFKINISLNDYIKELARHEVIHLLLARLGFIGGARWATVKEYVAAEEELVIKLLKIIKD